MEHFKLQFLMTVLFYLGPANAQKTCDAPVDLGFIIDASKTVTNDFERNMIEFIIKAAKRYRFSPKNGFQAGVVEFGDSSEVEIYFDSTDNYNSFRERVEKLTFYKAETTRIDLAFEKAKSMLFQTSRGYRGGEKAGFPAYALLISDGGQNPWDYPPSENHEATLKKAIALRKEGVKIIAFGLIDLGNNDDRNLHEPLLKKMASPGLYYRVNDTKYLLNLLDKLMEATCKVTEECADKKADAVFVVDTSSHGAMYLKQEKEIVKGIAKYYKIKDPGNKAGLVSYASTVMNEGYYKDEKDFNNKIDSLNRKGGASRLDLALEEASISLAQSSAEYRDLYVFTDGSLEKSSHVESVLKTATNLRSTKKLKFIIVAMGTNPDMLFLRSLTSVVRAPPGEEPKERAYKIACKPPGPPEKECYEVTECKSRRICPPTPTPTILKLD